MTLKKIVMIIAIGLIVSQNAPLLGATKTLQFTSGNITIMGTSADSFIGQVVQPMGDVNGDGKPDLFIGAPDKNTQRGSAFIFTTINGKIPTLPISESAVSINGKTINEFIGKFVAGNGDIDGDGLNDLVIADPLKSLISIYLGKDFSTWKTKPSTWFTSNFLNNAPNTNLPQFLSINGDVNGDGYDDILMGASSDLNDKNPTGRAYLIFGRPSIDSEDLNNLPLEDSPSVDVVFMGEHAQDGTGYSVAIIPDCNGDGYDDILIGSFRQNGNGTGKQAYLLYGRNSFASIASTNSVSLSKADATFLSQNDGTDGFGETVCGLGDINGDGYGDFAIGAPKTNSNQGAIYIYYGSQGTPFLASSKSGWSTTITGGSNNTEIGLHSIAGLGDVDGDGIHDIGIGELWNSELQTYAGKAHIVLGTDSTIPETTTLSLASVTNTTIFSTQASSQIGFTLSGQFDANQDGINDIIIGARNANNTKGQASIFSLASNITPNISSGIIKTFSSATFSQEQTQFKASEFIYIQVQGFDARTSSINSTEILVSSDSQTKPISIRLYDSPFHDKKYRQKIQLIQTRGSSKINQLFAKPNDTIYIQTKDNKTLKSTLKMMNSQPSATIQTLLQIGTGNNTTVGISYTLFDDNSDLIQFSQLPSQVQYSDDNSATWKDATIKGTTSGLQSSSLGTSYTQAEPLFWDAAKDIGVTDNRFMLRIKPYDGIDFSQSYVVSTPFQVDNLSPEAPLLSPLISKYSYTITVTGQAEALTTAYIYINDNLVATAPVSSEGVFEATGLSASPTRNTVTAKVVDSVGFSSPLSSPTLITFSPFEKTYASARATTSLALPLNAINTDKTLDYISENRFTTDPSPPTLYQFMDVFRFQIGEENTSVTLNQSATITVNLTFSLLTTNSITILFLNPDPTPTWTSLPITLKRISESQLVFTTQKIGLFAIAQYSDPFYPAIGTIKIDKSIMATNKFYSDNPAISVTLTDEDSGIASWSITLKKLDPETLIASTFQADVLASSNIEAKLLLGSTPLAVGHYKINARVWDNSNNYTEKDDFFFVDTSSLISEIIGGPNPYNPSISDFVFGYNFTLPVDRFEIHILSLAGKHLWDFEASDIEKAAGYHTVAWDGKINNQILPNGLYMAYCISEKDGAKKKTIIKIAILR